ncbi:hypothetical protein BsWGS_00792 [Bradybaena similaris]
MLFSSLQAQQCDTVTSLGLADPNIIPNSKIVTSSEAEGHGKEQIRLNCCEGTYDSAWCPDPKDKQPFVEIHLDKPVSIGEIDIQAPKMSQTTLRYPDNYMKTFDLVIKLAGINQLVSVAQNVSAIANASVSLNRISLYPTVFTDVIRIEPRDSENLPCFRMELFQCEATSMCPRNFCQNNGTCSQPNMCDCPDAYYGERCQYSKESIPLTVYKFLQIIGDTIVTASHNLTFYGNMSLENQSVLVVQPGGYLNLLDFSQSSCFSDLDKCTSGFTINIVFSISHLDTNSIVVLSNGGADDSRIRGITLLFQQGNIHCYASTSEKLWTVVTQFTLAEATWYKMTISWSLNLGLIVLQDRELVGSTFIPQTLDTPASRTNLLRLGNWEETSTSVLHFKGITMVPLDWQEFQRADLDKVDEDNFIDRYWDLRGISQLVIESHNWYLNLIGKPAFGEDGVTLTRIDQFIEIADIGSSCLTDPSLCTDGLTLKITIKLATIEEDSIIFTTGGEYKNHPGVTLLYRYGQFHAIVSTESLSWFVSVSRTTILTRDFCDIILSWSQHKSLKLIINQVLVGESASPIPHTNTTLPYIDKLTIGIGITECVISELHIWHSHVELLSQRGLIFCIPCSTPPTTSVTTAQTQPSTSAQSTGKTTREAPWFTDSTTEETTPYYYEDECPPGCVASDICFQVPETPSPEPTPSCDLTTQGSSPTTTAEDATTQQKITTASTVTKSTPPRSTPTLPSLTTRASTTTSTSIVTTKPPCPLPTACPNLTTNTPSLPSTTVTSSTNPPPTSTPGKLTTQPPSTVSTTDVTHTNEPQTSPKTTAQQTTAPQTTAPKTTVPETTAPQTTAQRTTEPQTTVPQTTVQETTTHQTTPQSSSTTTEKQTTPKCTSSESCPTLATSSTSLPPATTVTDATTPRTKTPQTTIQETTAPQTTARQTTVPQTTVPQTTAPQTTAPQTTAPQTTAPQTTAPQTTAPQTTILETTAPQTSSSSSIITDSTTEQPQSSSTTTEKQTTPKCTSSESCPTSATSSTSLPPATTVTDATTPSIITPQTTTPQTTAPRTTVPQTTAPQTTARQTTAPQTTESQTTSPQTIAPQTTEPQTTAPPTIVPQTTVPQTTAPQTTLTTEKPTTPKCTSSETCPTVPTSSSSLPPATTVTEATTPPTTAPQTIAPQTTTSQTAPHSTVPQTTAPKTTLQETTAPQTTVQETISTQTSTSSTTKQPPSSSTTTEKQTTPKCTSSESCPTLATSSTSLPPATTGTEATTPPTTAPQTTAQQTTTPQTTVQETTTPKTAPHSTVPQTTAPQTTVQETPAPQTTVQETTAPQTTVQETTAPQTTVQETISTQTVSSTTESLSSSSTTTEKQTTPKCTSSESCPTVATSSTSLPPATTVTDTTTPTTTIGQTTTPATIIEDSTTQQPQSSSTTEKPTTPKCTSSESCPTLATSSTSLPPATTGTEATTPPTTATTLPTTAPQTTVQETQAPQTTIQETTSTQTVSSTTENPSSSSTTTEKQTTPKCTSSELCPTSATSTSSLPPATTGTEATTPPTTATTPPTTAPQTTAQQTTPQTTVQETTTPQTESHSTVPQTTAPQTTVQETPAPQTTIQETTAPQTTVPETISTQTVSSTTENPSSLSTTIEKQTTPKCTSSESCPTVTTSSTSLPPATTVTDTTTPATTIGQTTTPATITEDSTTRQPQSSSTTEKPTTPKCTSSESCPTSATSSSSLPPATTTTEATTPSTTAPPTTAPQTTAPQTTVQERTPPQTTVQETTAPQTTVQVTTSAQTSSSSSSAEQSTTTKCTSSSSCPTSATSAQSSPPTSITDTTLPPSSPTTATESTTPQPPTPTTTKATTTTRSTTAPSTTTKQPCPQPPSSVTLIPEVSSSGQGLLICSVSAAPEPGIKIKFTWTIEGSSVQWSKEIEAPERSASISAAEINVQILNRAITCTAEVRYSTPNAEWCWPERSNVVVPSIKCPPVNGTIRVIEGREEQILQVQVTVPPSLLCRPEDGGQCRVEVTTTITTTSNELKCSAKEIIPQAVLGVSTVGQSGTQSCGVAITSGNWQNAVTIPIKATVDGVIDGNRNRKLQISVRIIGQITSITSFETCGEIDVIVIDRGDGATCSSVNDPHIKSWDNLRYNNFLPGEFVLANHKYLQYEVRALYSPCNPRQPKGATCNCGAAVRSGDDVITFDTCNTRQNQITSGGTSVITVDMYKNGELTPGTRVIRHGCGQKYEVVLPTRTKVVITSSVKPFLNINLQASSYDFESTEGLCGDFNNNPSDDLGGLNIKNPDAFNKQWLRNVTIFKGVPAFTTPARPTFCSCQSGQQPVCKPGLDVYICYAAATEANDITAALVSQAKTPLVLSQVRTSLFQVQSRGRRAVDTTNLQNPAASSVVTGFTSETALQYCQEYLENSTAVQNCLSHLKYDTLNESIRNCVEDLTADNDTQWATSHVDDLIVECLADVQANITTWENNENEDGPNIPQYINSSLCTQNCGEHGSCINSICECKEGWTGETCQIGSATTPTVLSAMLACDVMTASCNRILVEGNNFVSTKNLTCRIRYITVGDKVSVTGEEYTVPAIFISMIQVVCPENIASSLQSRSALVTLSNNGVTYSETNHIHIVQKSTCQTCTLRDDVSAVSCTWNPGSCVIDNKCYARFEPFEANTCYRCDPDVSLNKWTKISDPNCTLTQPEVGEFVTEPADNTTIIALGVVCGVLVLVAVGVIIAVVVRSRRRSSKLQRLWEGDPSLDIYHRRAIPSSADVSGQSDAARINAFYNPALSSSIDVSTN